MGTILGKGFASAQVHTEFIVQMLKAWVLWTVCTSACAKPFTKIIVPMAKLHSLIVHIYNVMMRHSVLLCTAKKERKKSSNCMSSLSKTVIKVINKSHTALIRVWGNNKYSCWCVAKNYLNSKLSEFFFCERSGNNFRKWHLISALTKNVLKSFDENWRNARPNGYILLNLKIHTL